MTFNEYAKLLTRTNIVLMKLRLLGMYTLYKHLSTNKHNIKQSVTV